MHITLGKDNIRFNYLNIFFILLVICAWGMSCTETPPGIVKNVDEFNMAIQNATPGDVITLANGEWEDAEIKFDARGSEAEWIRVKAETPGQVVFTGQSYLAFSGEYIEISGLVFKDGYTPTSEVISFKTSKTSLANHCRVTNCVIDNYSNPERFDSDYWVGMYGKNNQFDHNSLIGKSNVGVTMAVRLPTEASRENGHIIEYNYFGPRGVLGSNGGETLRIGTSHYSRTYSNTIVRNNYFDRVNGEHEIVSNKSCGNLFEGNVFFECQGTLTMRHGHHTTVQNNYFLGNGKPNTGGIRIINEYQTVKNNYLYGLTGHRFRGALVIMNGVPNSPINRYNQVVDSKMENNLVINSDYIQLCAGSDEERSATPVGTTFKNNLILGETNLQPFTIYDDVSGIEFAGNVMNESAEAPFDQGFQKVPLQLSKNEHGLIVPSEELLDQIGFGSVKLPVSKEEVGASFYPKDGGERSFDTGELIKVAAGEDALIQAIESSNPGDVLELENGGTYLMTKYAFVHHPITITSPAGEKAVILSEKQSFFKIENGGALQLMNLLFDGAESPDYAGNNVISTSKYSMNQNYALVVKDCEVKDLDKNHSFDFLKSYKHTFADSIIIDQSQFTNVTGAVMTLDMETEDLGVYNVENIKIQNSTFSDVQHEVVNVYRGGTDESTFGPMVLIENVSISNSGKGKRNQSGAVLRFHGVQRLTVNQVNISDSKGIDLYMTNGEPITSLSNIQFVNSAGLNTNNEPFEQQNIQNLSK
ncbi:polysaccharide lyase 6 family protein [Marinoscillum pacificum]|uniref:polysaccharide lyase 6 family protein n=1 Tax=Marinoscillum pacificum TaxID=392723 RepID=UPI00215706BB|nr:polysaccharide lyase 6 family protein [Marinoscillum pacificum]